MCVCTYTSNAAIVAAVMCALLSQLPSSLVDLSPSWPVFAAEIALASVSVADVVGSRMEEGAAEAAFPGFCFVFLENLVMR